MKANELMIGDWVIHDYYKTPTQIKAIPNAEQIYHSIPLISKILEKNGFVKGYNKWDKEETSDDVLYPYEIHLEDEGHFFYLEIWTYDAFVQTKICDVHELQRALRLCGLNELADNFQI